MHVRFADDITVITHIEKELQNILEIINLTNEK